MQVVLSEDAQKQYSHLPNTEQTKIRRRLMTLEQNPYSGKKLEGELSDIRSLRAWPYRILYEINEVSKRVEAYRFGDCFLALAFPA